jgi:hypothetical protein
MLLVIKKVQSLIETKSLPKDYQTLCFNFLLGILWLRFLPLQLPATEALSCLIRTYQFKAEFFQHFKAVQFATALHSSNLELWQFSGVDGQEQAEILDHLSLLGKTLSQFITIDSVLPQTVAMFLAFMNSEYLALHKKDFCMETKNSEVLDIETQGETVIERMTIANMVDSDNFRKYRRVSKCKLHVYLTILKEVSLTKVAEKDELYQILFRLLGSSD